MVEVVEQCILQWHASQSPSMRGCTRCQGRLVARGEDASTTGESCETIQKCNAPACYDSVNLKAKHEIYSDSRKSSLQISQCCITSSMQANGMGGTSGCIRNVWNLQIKAYLPSRLAHKNENKVLMVQTMHCWAFPERRTRLESFPAWFHPDTCFSER